MAGEPLLNVKNLDMEYGEFVVMRDLNFTVNRGDIFIIMGESGCGKSTLLKILIGLKRPLRGKVLYEDTSFWEADSSERERMMRRFGILYQYGALWSSMTLEENIALPLQYYTKLNPSQIKKIVLLKLSLVGLAGFEEVSVPVCLQLTPYPKGIPSILNLPGTLPVWNIYPQSHNSPLKALSRMDGNKASTSAPVSVWLLVGWAWDLGDRV